MELGHVEAHGPADADKGSGKTILAALPKSPARLVNRLPWDTRWPEFAGVADGDYLRLHASLRAATCGVGVMLIELVAAN